MECKTPGASGRLYYINKDSGKISWTKPATGSIVPSVGGSGEKAAGKSRWSALRSTITTQPDGSAAGEKKSSQLVRSLLEKARRKSQIGRNTEGVSDAPPTSMAARNTAPTKESAANSPFTKKKSAYQNALARARAMVLQASSPDHPVEAGMRREAVSPASSAISTSAATPTADDTTANAKKPLASAAALREKFGLDSSSTPPKLDSKDMKQLARAKRVLQDWRTKTCGRWFKRWQLGAMSSELELEKKRMGEKLRQSENALKLTEARSELALARCEVSAWRRAKSEKDVLVRKMAIARLRKWEKNMNNRTREGFEQWKRFVDYARVVDIETLKTIVQKQTEEMSMYKTALKDTKKKYKAVTKEMKKMKEAAPESLKRLASQSATEQGTPVKREHSSDGSQGPANPRSSETGKEAPGPDRGGQSGSALSTADIGLDSPGLSSQMSSSSVSSFSGQDTDTLAKLEQSLLLVEQQRKENSSLEDQNRSLKDQVQRMTAECNRLIAVMKEQELKQQSTLAGVNVVDKGELEKAKVEAEHWAKVAEERDLQNKALAEDHAEERNKWMRRFQMQQETIEGLENDVEELSELKVLELAENYYVSSQNGYN
jgi:hypothetical protein